LVVGVAEVAFEDYGRAAFHGLLGGVEHDGEGGEGHFEVFGAVVEADFVAEDFFDVVFI
jgi:hypothetical protein